MKKTMLVLLTVVLLTGCNQAPKESEADAYLKDAWSFVEAGKCDSAQNAYSQYLQAGRDSLPELEEAIDACRFETMMRELDKAAAKQEPRKPSRINISDEQIHQLFLEDEKKDSTK